MITVPRTKYFCLLICPLSSDPSMRPRPDADVIVIAPVGEVMPAFGARSRVIGNFIGRQSGIPQNILRQLIHRAASSSGAVSGSPRAARV